MATAESLTMSPREHHQTYFGLPVHDGKVGHAATIEDDHHALRLREVFRHGQDRSVRTLENIDSIELVACRRTQCSAS